MKKTKEKSDNTIINNLYKETIETTPDDGWIEAKEINPTKINHYRKGNRKYYKGFSKTVSYTTNDPRITRPIAYSMCGIFLIIGIIMLLFRNWFFGIIFATTAISVFFKFKKSIDKIAEELKNKGQDVTIDSIEEKEQLRKETIEIANKSIGDVTNIFKKSNYK